MTSFKRQPAIKVARIAREVAQWDRAITGMSDGGETAGSTVLAPLEDTSTALENAEITPDSMVITRVSDGHVYEAGTDYLEQQHGFLNVTIPEGEEVEVTYLRGDYTLPGHRIQLNGVTLTQRELLNFLADAGAVVDNEANDSTDVDLMALTSSRYPLPLFGSDGTVVTNAEGEPLVTWIDAEDLL